MGFMIMKKLSLQTSISISYVLKDHIYQDKNKIENLVKNVIKMVFVEVGIFKYFLKKNTGENLKTNLSFIIVNRIQKYV